jgi:nitric oxide reductase subunit C
MWKYIAFGALLCAYLLYSGLVFTRGTENPVTLDEQEQVLAGKGKLLFQQYNCIACHQLFGLGGFLGPDLTNAYSDPRRGTLYIRALLESGGNRMPDFHFTPEETDALIAYLKYVDQVAAGQPETANRR